MKLMNSPLVTALYAKKLKPFQYYACLVAALFALSTTAYSTAAYAQNTYDPCPSPKSALQNTPNDLAKIQEDIDRFTLCVERAQLLERLNTLVEKNIETIDSALLQSGGGLPALPIAGQNSNNGGNDFSGLPGSNSNDSDDSIFGGRDSISAIDENDLGGFVEGVDSVSQRMTDRAQSATSSSIPAANVEPEEPEWRIREIYGIGRQLQARLISSENRIERVQQGSTIGDNIRVIEVSKTSVKLKDGEDVLDLEWVNDTGAEDME
jgi:hypothetical protein